MGLLRVARALRVSSADRVVCASARSFGHSDLVLEVVEDRALLEQLRGSLGTLGPREKAPDGDAVRVDSALAASCAFQPPKSGAQVARYEPSRARRDRAHAEFCQRARKRVKRWARIE